MVWCPFWFIVACKGFLSTLNHLFDAHALSTRFGYGRHAFLARAFAAAFWVAVNGLLVLGFLVSQNAFLVAITYASCPSSVYHLASYGILRVLSFSFWQPLFSCYFHFVLVFP